MNFQNSNLPAVNQFADALRAEGFEPPPVIEPGRFHKIPGPSDSGTRKKRGWIKLHADERGGVYGDFATGETGSWQIERATHPLAPADRTRIEHARKAQAALDATREARSRLKARRLWRAAIPVHSTLAERYLRARGCAIPPCESHVHFHPSVWHWGERREFPAMVSAITHAETRAPLSLHLTFLDPSGERKAQIERPKLMLPALPIGGGVIRIWPDDEVTMGLGVAEGIENALVLAHALFPVWACVSAHGMETMPFLHGLDCLTICSDPGEAGQRAAAALRDRYLAGGTKVRVWTSPTSEDLSDIAMRQARDGGAA